MTSAPVPPDWVEGETATEARMDSISAAINFLRSPPYAQLGRSSNQSVSDTTSTPVGWNSSTFDTVDGHSTVTNNTRYTAVYDGHYELSVSIPWINNTDTMKFECSFRRSDGEEFIGNSVMKTPSNVTIALSTTRTIALTTGQWVEVYVWHNRGASTSIDASFRGGPRWDIRWVGAL